MRYHRVILLVLVLMALLLPDIIARSASIAYLPVQPVISDNNMAKIFETGYNPSVHGFIFENRGDREEFFGIDLNKITGLKFRDEIFRHTGHCYGMSLMSVEIFKNGVTARDVSKEDVMPMLDRAQTDQSLHFILDFFRPPFGKKNTENEVEYRKIRARIASGEPTIVAIYTTKKDHEGHSVVAYKIEEVDDKAYIHFYDPNIPVGKNEWYAKKQQVAEYSLNDGKFSYNNGKHFDVIRLHEIDRQSISNGATFVVSLGVLLLGVVSSITGICFRR